MTSTELLQNKLEFYREQTDRVRQFIYSRKDIGEPCQPLYDAIFDKLNEQQKEIERLKELVEFEFRVTNTAELMMRPSYRTQAKIEKEVEERWGKFKTENNL